MASIVSGVQFSEKALRGIKILQSSEYESVSKYVAVVLNFQCILCDYCDEGVELVLQHVTCTHLNADLKQDISPAKENHALVVEKLTALQQKQQEPSIYEEEQDTLFDFDFKPAMLEWRSEFDFRPDINTSHEQILQQSSPHQYDKNNEPSPNSSTTDIIVTDCAENNNIGGQTEVNMDLGQVNGGQTEVVMDVQGEADVIMDVGQVIQEEIVNISSNEANNSVYGESSPDFLNNTTLMVPPQHVAMGINSPINLPASQYIHNSEDSNNSTSNTSQLEALLTCTPTSPTSSSSSSSNTNAMNSPAMQNNSSVDCIVTARDNFTSIMHNNRLDDVLTTSAAIKPTAMQDINRGFNHKDVQFQVQKYAMNKALGKAEVNNGTSSNRADALILKILTSNDFDGTMAIRDDNSNVVDEDDKQSKNKQGKHNHIQREEHINRNLSPENQVMESVSLSLKSKEEKIHSCFKALSERLHLDQLQTTKDSKTKSNEAYMHHQGLGKEFSLITKEILQHTEQVLKQHASNIMQNVLLNADRCPHHVSDIGKNTALVEKRTNDVSTQCNTEVNIFENNATESRKLSQSDIIDNCSKMSSSRTSLNNVGAMALPSPSQICNNGKLSQNSSFKNFSVAQELINKNSKVLNTEKIDMNIQVNSNTETGTTSRLEEKKCHFTESKQEKEKTMDNYLVSETLQNAQLSTISSSPKTYSNSYQCQNNKTDDKEEIESKQTSKQLNSSVRTYSKRKPVVSDGGNSSPQPVCKKPCRSRSTSNRKTKVVVKDEALKDNTEKIKGYPCPSIKAACNSNIDEKPTSEGFTFKRKSNVNENITKAKESTVCEHDIIPKNESESDNDESDEDYENEIKVGGSEDKRLKLCSLDDKRDIICVYCEVKFENASDCFRHYDTKHEDGLNFRVNKTNDSIVSSKVKQRRDKYILNRIKTTAIDNFGLEFNIKLDLSKFLSDKDLLSRNSQEHEMFDSPEGEGEEIEPDTCPMCYLKYRPSYLLKHIAVVHYWGRVSRPKVEPGLFICSVCGKGFTYKRNMEAHEKNVHHGKRKMVNYNQLKDLECPHCDYSSKERRRLESHVRSVHMGVTPYKCEHCEFECKERTSLRDHMYRHFKHKPISCAYCDYGCIQRSSMKIHLKKKHGIVLDAVKACQKLGKNEEEGRNKRKSIIEDHNKHMIFNKLENLIDWKKKDASKDDNLVEKDIKIIETKKKKSPRRKKSGPIVHVTSQLSPIVVVNNGEKSSNSPMSIIDKNMSNECNISNTVDDILNECDTSSSERHKSIDSATSEVDNHEFSDGARSTTSCSNTINECISPGQCISSPDECFLSNIVNSTLPPDNSDSESTLSNGSTNPPLMSPPPSHTPVVKTSHTPAEEVTYQLISGTDNSSQSHQMLTDSSHNVVELNMAQQQQQSQHPVQQQHPPQLQQHQGQQQQQFSALNTVEQQSDTTIPSCTLNFHSVHPSTVQYTTLQNIPHPNLMSESEQIFNEQSSQQMATSANINDFQGSGFSVQSFGENEVGFDVMKQQSMQLHSVVNGDALSFIEPAPGVNAMTSTFSAEQTSYPVEQGPHNMMASFPSQPTVVMAPLQPDCPAVNTMPSLLPLLNIQSCESVDPNTMSLHDKTPSTLHYKPSPQSTVPNITTSTFLTNNFNTLLNSNETADINTNYTTASNTTDLTQWSSLLLNSLCYPIFSTQQGLPALQENIINTSEYVTMSMLPNNTASYGEDESHELIFNKV